MIQYRHLSLFDFAMLEWLHEQQAKPLKALGNGQVPAVVATAWELLTVSN